MSTKGVNSLLLKVFLYFISDSLSDKRLFYQDIAYTD